MTNPQLEQYIKNARESHLSDDVIRQNLIASGWKSEDIDSALHPGAIPIAPVAPRANYSETTVNVATPATWWIAFTYILLFISLYITASALGEIVGWWIDKLSPAHVDIYGRNAFSILVLNIAIASVVVAFPIFAFCAVYLQNQIRKIPELRLLPIRQKLIYITLVITFLITVEHLISTVYTFLNNAGTVNAVLHLVNTLVFSGSIFFYFLADVRKHKSV